MADLVHEPLEPLLAQTSPGELEAGAIVVFAGSVRRHNEDREVAFLEYSAHPALATRAMAEIEAQILGRPGILSCRLWHRIGRLELGEISVLIIVCSVHRAEAYAASRAAIEAVKQRLPIWKHEHYTDGTSKFVEGCCLESP